MSDECKFIPASSFLFSANRAAIKVDRNFSYAVFVSYAEVYNEKVRRSSTRLAPELTKQIFDLLDNVLPITPAGKSNGHQRSSSQYGYPGAFASSMNLAAMANGGGGVLKRKALVLKNDPEGNGKYIAGLNDIRVKTRQVSWPGPGGAQKLMETGSTSSIPHRPTSPTSIRYISQPCIQSFPRYLHPQNRPNP
jgi:hypothetical protein